MSSGIFFQFSAVLMVSFYAVIIPFQAVFFAFDWDTKCQRSDIVEIFVKSFFVMLKLVGCEIKFLSFLFRFQKLVIATLLYVSINFLCSLLITSLSRRESINSELCFSVFAYPSVELLFFILLTNSSMFILPLNSGVCFMLNFLRTLPYFFTQLYAVAGQISALSYSLKCLLTSL